MADQWQRFAVAMASANGKSPVNGQRSDAKKYTTTNGLDRQSSADALQIEWNSLDIDQTPWASGFIEMDLEV